MKRLFIQICALLFAAALCASPAEAQGRLVFPVLKKLLAGSEKFHMGLQLYWSTDIYEQLETAAGHSIPTSELQQPLDRASRAFAGIKTKLDAYSDLPEDVDHVAYLEDLAETLMRERWALALQHARHYVALSRQAIADGELPAGSYSMAMNHLVTERNAIAEAAGALLTHAQEEGRTEAWEQFADFADSVIQAGVQDGLGTQLDSFLKGSVLEYIDPTTGERITLDMSFAFEPYAILFPGEDESAAPQYPQGGSWEHAPGIKGIVEIRASSTDEPKECAELVTQFRRDYGKVTDPLVEVPAGGSLRILAVLGSDLIPEDGTLPTLVETDPWMEYIVLHAIPGGSIPLYQRKDDAFRRLKSKLTELAPDETLVDPVLRLDQVFVLAVTKKGSVPTPRFVQLNGHRGQWYQSLEPLKRSAAGVVRFRRALPDGGLMDLNHMFQFDQFVVEVQLNREIELDQFDVTLGHAAPGATELVPVDLDGISGVWVHKVKGDGSLFRSKPLQHWDGVGRPVSWLGTDGALPLAIPIGETLFAMLPPIGIIAALPASTRVVRDPTAIQRDWKLAVDRSGEVAGVLADPHRPQATHATVLTSLFEWVLEGDQRVRISVGDHAGLLLLRNELLRQLREKRNELMQSYDRILQDDDRAVEYLTRDLVRQVQNGNLALASMTIEDSIMVTTTFGQWIQNGLYPEFPEAREQIIRVARSLAVRTKNKLGYTIQRLENAEDHHYEELIVLAGLGSQRLADELGPDMVYFQEFDGVWRWNRYPTAHNHMKSMNVLFTRFTAAKDYAKTQIDSILTVASVGALGAEYYGLKFLAFGLEAVLFSTPCTHRPQVTWRTPETLNSRWAPAELFPTRESTLH